MRVLIIGGGYCGLAAAMKLGDMSVSTVLAEATGAVGGLSQVFRVGEAAFELGPHIYFDKDPEIVAFWETLVGDELRCHTRQNRLYYNGKYLKSPLSLVDAFFKLGPVPIARMLASFAHAKVTRPSISNAEDWVVANFGRELYERFFRVYNEKIWGLPSRDIAPDWAGQRIKASLFQMIVRSIVRDPRFIVKTFLFPKGGSESIYAAQERVIRSTLSTELRLNCCPVRIDAMDGGGFRVKFSDRDDVEHFTHVISTIHLSDLNAILRFPDKPENEIDKAISSLVYRNLVLANLVMPPGSVEGMQEHWIDVHDPAVKALRVTNFSNYQNPTIGRPIALSVEYNCFEEDALWTSSDKDVLEVARSDLARMKLTREAPTASSIVRVPRAYPVYVRGYREQLQTIYSSFEKVEGLILAGRNALYKWNNMHHSVRTGLWAAENVLGAKHDLHAVRGSVTIGKDSD